MEQDRESRQTISNRLHSVYVRCTVTRGFAHGLVKYQDNTTMYYIVILLTFEEYMNNIVNAQLEEGHVVVLLQWEGTDE